MDIEAIKSSMVEFVRLNQVWAPFIVGGLAFGESLAVISLFVPATVLLLGIGALVGASDISFWSIWLAAAVGASLGDWLSYEVGRYVGAPAKTIWPLNKQPHLVDRAERFMHKHGVWGVFIGRFFGPVRALVPLVAGIFHMPRLHFQAANIGSALIWAFVLLAPGAGLMNVLHR